MKIKYMEQKLLENEIWKDVPGFEGLYQASTLGRIRGLDKYIGGINGSKRFFRGRVVKLHKSKSKHFVKRSQQEI